MAAFSPRSLSPESSKPNPSRPRHNHDRRRTSRSRRPKSEPHSPPRCSAPYQVQRPLQQQQQLPTPMTTPDISTLSLSAPIEHHRSITMERTPSGNSIMSEDPSDHPQHDNTFIYSDGDAARRVERHFRRRKHERSERILRGLIERADSLDDVALDSILTTTDSIFFHGALSRRVKWEWSSDDRYQTELIGTTALRRCTDRKGFETLIILSQPILKNPCYDRRLLLSAFLHELVHCYLFIQCGFRARMEGGHTQGFHTIAEIIDNWVGGGYLSLCNMKANLNHFRNDRERESMVVFDMGRGVEAFTDERWPWPSHLHEHGGCGESPRPESGGEYLDPYQAFGPPPELAYPTYYE